MTEQLVIDALQASQFPQVHEAFIAAFADYQAPMKPSADELRQRFKRICLDYRLSAGAFSEGRLVGFILTGRGAFQGVPTAYNGGTGVLPAWRKKGLGRQLYDFLLPLYRKHGIGQCLLEVMEGNGPALQLYEGMGFERQRLLRCYAALAPIRPQRAQLRGLQLSEATRLDWEQYETLGDTLPSWQNSQVAVTRGMSYEVVIEAYFRTGLVGYITFSPENGRISQLAVDAPHRGQGIGAQLLLHAQKAAGRRLSILNVDAADEATCRFFAHQGFKNIINQWEMTLSL